MFLASNKKNLNIPGALERHSQTLRLRSYSQFWYLVPLSIIFFGWLSSVSAPLSTKNDTEHLRLQFLHYSLLALKHFSGWLSRDSAMSQHYSAHKLNQNIQCCNFLVYKYTISEALFWMAQLWLSTKIDSEQCNLCYAKLLQNKVSISVICNRKYDLTVHKTPYFEIISQF